jgi:hypothetical protein
MNPRLLRPVASGFNPKSISGLALWLDGADGATLFDAGTGGSLVGADGGVGRWEDKSGNGRHATQDTANNRPLLRLATQNGRAGLEFDASNDFLATASFPHTVAISTFVAHRFTSTPGGNVRVIEHGANNGHAIIHSLGNYRYSYSSAGANDSNFPTSTSPVVLSYLATDASPRALSFFQSGVPGFTNTNSGTPVTPSQFNINRFGGGSFHSPQIVYEILYYNRALTSPERQKVERYLGAKWGITIT